MLTVEINLHEAETFVASIVPYSTGGASWKQTSYNNNFRKQYAGIGHTYDASKDKFICHNLIHLGH